MIATKDEVISAGLALPPKYRTEVIHQLLDSLNVSDLDDIERAWAEEAESRLASYERGELEAIPAEDVYRDIRAELRK